MLPVKKTQPLILKKLAFPSIENPDLAPKGKSVMSATVQHIPYKLKNEYRTWR